MDIKKRINRLIGQLKGIERMVDNERDCAEVLQQVSAIKKAIDGLSKELLITDICKYVPKTQTKNIERVVERAINL